MAPQKVNIKERYSEGEIDLSMSDLQDVPVKDIAVFKKAVSLDLSNNHLKSLPQNFSTTLSYLTKLDLSKNQITELPENFGDLVKLKYLDLYQNKLESLPISVHKLKALKWLDLKDNPLTPALSKIAGPCLDPKQCQTCAKEIVDFYSEVQEQVVHDLEEKLKEKRALEASQKREMDNKKIKKKNKPKQKKENEVVKENVPKPSNKKNKKGGSNSSQKSSGGILATLKQIFMFWLFVVAVLFVLTSVKLKYTQIVEDKCVELYKTGVESAPPHVKVYLTTVGGYVNVLHNKTGNLTMATVQYVTNKDNYSKAYALIEEYVAKIKEQISKYTS